MFERSAAIGVRSSCEASAIRWRWASTERSSAVSVWLKLDGEAADLDRALLIQAPRLLERACDLLDLAGEATDRRQRRARDNRADQPGKQHAAGDEQGIGHEQRAQRGVRWWLEWTATSIAFLSGSIGTT